MLKVHSEPAKPKLKPQGTVLLALGFRPFFLLAALSSVLLMISWLMIWSGAISAPQGYGVIGWHSHEMLFGYTAAVIAGFLLTAVRNWTGVNTPSGAPLLALVILWMAGRLLPFTAPLIPQALISLVDIAFLPAVALALMPALWQGAQKINRIFVPLLLVMGVANLLVHLQTLGLAQTANQGTNGMLLLVVLLVSLLGGRVIPFFTEAVIPGHASKRTAWVEQITMVAFALLILEQLLYPIPLLTALLALLIAVSQGLRVAGWHHPQVWRQPILWVLYSGLIWIIIGMLMLSLSMFNLAPVNLAKHALTVGGIGILTFGMMARVALGHTGRPIEPHRLISISFVVLNVAAATRVFGPLIHNNYTLWIHLSGTLWALAFLIFCLVYLPMLMKPRVDGKAG